MVVVETTVFTNQVQKYLSDEEYKQFQSELILRPEMGAIIPKGGGLRKVRWRYRGRGKRGGVRVIYYWAVSQDQLLMLFMYPKNVKDNLSPAQLSLLRQIVEDEYP